MMLWAEDTASARALGSVRGAGNRPGGWHGSASLEGDSDGAQVMGVVREGAGTPPALPQCSACLAGIFQEVPTCPWLSPSGEHDSLGGGLSGTTGVALPAVGQAAYTASHPHWEQLSTRGCSPLLDKHPISLTSQREQPRSQGYQWHVLHWFPGLP